MNGGARRTPEEKAVSKVYEAATAAATALAVAAGVAVESFLQAGRQTEAARARLGR